MTGRPEVGPYRPAAPCKRQGWPMTPIAPTPIAAIHQRTETFFQSLENARKIFPIIGKIG